MKNVKKHLVPLVKLMNSWNKGQQKSPHLTTECRYHAWRNDDSMTPKQKIGMAMRETRDNLTELERVVRYNVKLKNELNVDSRDYWKNTHKALSKISERLVRLANKVGQLNQKMPFEEQRKSYMDSLYGISTLLKRWHTEIQRKDVDKNYMIKKLTEWIKKLEDLRHEIMMGKDK